MKLKWQAVKSYGGDLKLFGHGCGLYGSVVKLLGVSDKGCNTWLKVFAVAVKGVENAVESFV